MPSVLVVMMQRDEGPVLARWLAHYVALFGHQALTIIDNGSVDPFTLQLLAAAEARGCRVIRKHTSALDFYYKGVIVTQTVQAIEAAEKYDFVLPVDCDELLAVFTPARISLSAADIGAEFGHWLGFERVLRIGMSLFNVPGQEGWFCPNRQFHKGFVPGRQLASLDKGYHVPSIHRGDEYITTRFTYLHHHNVPLHQLRSNARRKLQEPYASCRDPEQLRLWAVDPEVPGNHLLADLLLDEAQYYRLYEDDLRIMVDGAHDQNALMRTAEGLLMWDEAAYLSRNPDVGGYQLGPLMHYVEWGYREGRRL